jgi:hypothetical protein
MSHSISAVVESCLTTPLTLVWMPLSWKSQPVTSPGPIGARVSDPLTRSMDPASVSRKS